VLLSVLVVGSRAALTLDAVPADIAAFKNICLAVPNSILGLCNNTCSQCTSSAPSNCVACNTGYILSGKHCLLDNSNSNYTYYQYASINLLSDVSQITAFTYTKTNTPLGYTDLLSTCQSSPNSFEFDSVGLFKSTDQVQIAYNYVDPIDKIQIKFNFKSVVSSMKLFITLNDNIIFSRLFT
jgi:hypothetical protein